MLFLIRLAARFNDIRQYFLKLLAIHLSSSSPNLLSAHSRPAHTFRKERGTYGARQNRARMGAARRGNHGYSLSPPAGISSDRSQFAPLTYLTQPALCFTDGRPFRLC